MKNPQLNAIIMMVVLSIITYFVFVSTHLVTYLSLVLALILGAKEFKIFIVGNYVTLAFVFFVTPLVLGYIVRKFFHKKYSFHPNYLVLFMVGAISIYGSMLTANLIQKQRYQVAATDAPVANIEPGQVIQLSGGENTKTRAKISGQRVIWMEHVKKFPPYDKNVWEIMMFDLKTKKKIQISNLEQSLLAGMQTNYEIFGDAIFWTQDHKILTYDISTQSTSVLIDNVFEFFVVNDKHLLFSRIVNSKPEVEFFLYDRAQKTEQSLETLRSIPKSSLYNIFFSNFVVNRDSVVFTLNGYTTSSREHYVAAYRYIVSQKKLSQILLPLDDSFVPLQSFDDGSVLFIKTEDKKSNKELEISSFLVFDLAKDEFYQLSSLNGRAPSKNRYIFDEIGDEKNKEMLVNAPELAIQETFQLNSIFRISAFDIVAQKTFQLESFDCANFCPHGIEYDIDGNMIVWSYKRSKENGKFSNNVFLYIIKE